MHRTVPTMTAAALVVAASACGPSDDRGRATADSAGVSVSTPADDVTTTAVAATTTPGPATTTPAAPTTATPSTTEVDVEARRPYSVSTSTFTLVDASRSTPATDTSEELPERTINVVLHLPDSNSPVPLVVFSHGLGGHPDVFETLFRAWTESGYAVAAPVFPLTNRDGAGFSIADGVNQPADVSFVIDQLFDESSEIGRQMAGRLDPQRIGAAGLSFGGATTYEVALNDRVRDERIRAAVIMAGVRFTNSDDGSFVAADVPVYLLHGEADPVVPVGVSEEAFHEFGDTAFFVTLLGGGHSAPFEDEAAGHTKIAGMDAVIAETTTAFWDRVLLDDPSAADRLTASADVDGLSELARNACALGFIGDGGYADATLDLSQCS